MTFPPHILRLVTWNSLPKQPYFYFSEKIFRNILIRRYQNAVNRLIYYLVFVFLDWHGPLFSPFLSNATQNTHNENWKTKLRFLLAIVSVLLKVTSIFLYPCLRQIRNSSFNSQNERFKTLNGAIYDNPPVLISDPTKSAKCFQFHFKTT